MGITDLTNSGAIPALQTTIRFASQRQRLIAHNIANLTTPDFRPKDVSVKGFQENLAEAIDRRRQQGAGARGPLELSRTREIRPTGDRGEFRLTPAESGRNILFHDRNNRSLERQMQALVENSGAFQFAASVLQSRYAIMQTAISERV